MLNVPPNNLQRRGNSSNSGATEENNVAVNFPSLSAHQLPITNHLPPSLSSQFHVRFPFFCLHKLFPIFFCNPITCPLLCHIMSFLFYPMNVRLQHCFNALLTEPFLLSNSVLVFFYFLSLIFCFFCSVRDRLTIHLPPSLSSQFLLNSIIIFFLLLQ